MVLHGINENAALHDLAHPGIIIFLLGHENKELYTIIEIVLRNWMRGVTFYRKLLVAMIAIAVVGVFAIAAPFWRHYCVIFKPPAAVPTYVDGGSAAALYRIVRPGIEKNHEITEGHGPENSG